MSLGKHCLNTKGIHFFLVLFEERNPLHGLLDFLFPDVLHFFVNDHPGNRNEVVWSDNSWEDHVSDCLGYLQSSLVVALDVVCNRGHCLLVLCCILSISHVKSVVLQTCYLGDKFLSCWSRFFADMQWKFFLFPSTLGFGVSFF
jgi:hypothetical protein